MALDHRLSAVRRPCLVWLAAVITPACAAPAGDADYFGSIEPPAGQHLRYVTGSEPESLDPQIGTGQPEARIYAALFEGLTEFHPETSEAIPGLAERWEVLDGNTAFLFHLRRNARWSDGHPITAHDFVYTIRRGLSPALASRNAYMAYDILYAQAFNEGGLFARDSRTGDWITDPVDPARRLVVPGEEGARGAAVPPAARGALRGAAFVPVGPEDVGVEAVDDYTVRIRTERPVPFLPKLLSHQFFRVVPRRAIEAHGEAWTRPEHLVASGPFVLAAWRPYDRLIISRNPMYWDAASVRLDRITFYPLDDATTMMNLYKSGYVDALYNHTVPVAWLDEIRRLKDYMDAPEAAVEFLWINTTRPPMDDVRVRRAFALAIDRRALAEFRRVVRPLAGLVPEGIFPGYPNPPVEPFNPRRAQALLAEAGFRDGSGRFDPSRFPAGEVELTYNTSESNRQVAEFIQAQFRQHLGITVPLRNMEFRTFLGHRNRREYRGVARGGWVGDYMDPFTFLDLLSTAEGNNGSGWTDRVYTQMLRDANRETEPARRYALLAAAERLMLEAQPVIPLYTAATNWIRKPYVKGMYPNPLTIHPWKFVWIEHDPARWD